MDQQLDALDQALNMLERRRDKIHEEAQQLLVDARAARMKSQNAQEPTATNGESGEDSRDNGDNCNSESKND